MSSADQMALRTSVHDILAYHADFKDSGVNLVKPHFEILGPSLTQNIGSATLSDLSKTSRILVLI